MKNKYLLLLLLFLLSCSPRINPIKGEDKDCYYSIRLQNVRDNANNIFKLCFINQETNQEFEILIEGSDLFGALYPSYEYFKYNIYDSMYSYIIKNDVYIANDELTNDLLNKSFFIIDSICQIVKPSNFKYLIKKHFKKNTNIGNFIDMKHNKAYLHNKELEELGCLIAVLIDYGLAFTVFDNSRIYIDLNPQCIPLPKGDWF